MANTQLDPPNERTGSGKPSANLAVRWLANPRLLPLYLAVLAMILTLPSLWVGFQFDDYSHRIIFLGLDQPPPANPFRFLNAFSFLPGDPAAIGYYRDMGALPWWTSDHLQLSFMRYLSAASMWVDYMLWPDSPPLMHLHSMAWYAALVAATTLFYRRFMGLTFAAGLAALFYAIDFSHATPVSWLANRNALLAVFFGVLCLLAYDTYRQGGKRWYGVLGAVYLALSLLSGETGLATAAYLFAYALFLDRDKWRARFLALLPSGCVFVCWAVCYRALGFGANGSGFYVDPATSPIAFAKAFIIRAPLLLMGQWSHVSADSVGIMISKTAALIIATILVLLLVIMLSSLVRKNRVARFWLVGMLLSLVPAASTYPHNRLLLFAGLGAMGLMGQFLMHLKRNDGLLPVSKFWRIPAFVFAGYLVLVRCVVSPLMMPVSAYGIKAYGDPITHAARTIPDDAMDAKDLILVNPPDSFTPGLIWSVRMIEGRRLPNGLKLLTTGSVPAEIHRVDLFTLRVRLQGGLFSDMYSGLFRSQEEDPIELNGVFQTPRMSATVTKLGKDGPEEIVYRFSFPLENPAFKWLQWKDWAYVDFIPPAVGQTVSFEPVDLLRELLEGKAKTASNYTDPVPPY